MNFGKVIEIKLSGDTTLNLEEFRTKDYLQRATHPESQYVQVAHEKSDGQYRIELAVTPEKILTLHFRNTANELLCSADIKDEEFYGVATKYRKIVKDFQKAYQGVYILQNTDRSILSDIDGRRTYIHGYGTGILKEVLKSGTSCVTEPKTAVEFIGTEERPETRALFYLCAHALK